MSRESITRFSENQREREIEGEREVEGERETERRRYHSNYGVRQENACAHIDALNLFGKRRMLAP